MPITTMTSRSFNQEISRAKKAAEEGPVYITDRGEPAHVLLTYEAFKKLSGSRRSILDALATPNAGDIDFEPERGNIVSRDVDF
ncbi:prevent-host-death protein [Chimaeribacter arupi]|uniref:Antitoxin n=2 Tax=Yersiniaceae TaxID=1903411 RepID=A0A2N5EJ04_9GAMM|nr:MULTISPECIES: type II toxin-antitoxin system prevent-host-death family antitoxin [Yersiniaceae]MBS0967574.1 type II toxin-antitoxin system Phd/YefM family antitoxin [Nissabacter archeti]MDV5140963.1 type II toxin-antitoxin system prevent-host-death family antitoxin [Chimaeribacter arupi]PLR29231.1 prevent-host-death protein [Chimaeribacter arupi]PLR42551.1 prevent-host-death protein [Chimaeribacter arupi]PLR45225.1 prevent-host-death protein [Chimaeribacter arupi]